MADRAQKGQSKGKGPAKGPAKGAKKTPTKKGGNDEREDTLQAVVRSLSHGSRGRLGLNRNYRCLRIRSRLDLIRLHWKGRGYVSSISSHKSTLPVTFGSDVNGEGLSAGVLFLGNRPANTTAVSPAACKYSSDRIHTRVSRHVWCF
jgi:hypothetical protein